MKIDEREETIDRNLKVSHLTRVKKALKKPFHFPFLYFLWLIYKIFPNLNFALRIKSETIWGDKMVILLPTYASIFALGFFEYKLTKFLLKNLKRGDIFIDGGAHIGYYALLASELVDKNGKVIAFEPTPSIFKILERNIKD